MSQKRKEYGSQNEYLAFHLYRRGITSTWQQFALIDVNLDTPTVKLTRRWRMSIARQIGLVVYTCTHWCYNISRHTLSVIGVGSAAVSLYIRTATDSKQSAMMNVPIQLTTLAAAMAFGRGPCRNSSAPIIIGIGPAQCIARRHWVLHHLQHYTTYQRCSQPMISWS